MTIKKLISMMLVIVTVVTNIVLMTSTVSATISESTFDTKVEEFISDSRWKNGISWGDNQAPKLSTYASIGCCSYAADFVAYVYGSTKNAWYTSDFTAYENVNDIRKGDIIHLSNHWFVVLDRIGDTFYTAEGNFDDKVRITKNGWAIKNGVVHNLVVSDSARVFDCGYHYNFSSTGSTGDTNSMQSNQVYYNIDMSAAVLKSRTQQQVSGDCAVVSMATVEAYLYGATSTADKETVYNALVSKNGDNDYAYWDKCGYLRMDTINWTDVYNQLAKGYPVIVHRPATSSKSEHWAVVAGYKGSTTTLEKDKFIVVDVYHGTGGTDIMTTGSWRGSTTIDRMSPRKNGIAITGLTGTKFAIDHPVLVHQSGNGHGVYGYITSNENLTSIQFLVTNVNTGAAVYNKTVTPNSKSYLIYNLDSEFTFAKWSVGDYYFTVIAKTASSTNVYNKYFKISSGWPTTEPKLYYTFNYDTNGGSGSIASQTVAHDGVITVTTTIPTKAGYKFLGWNVKRGSDGKSYCPGIRWLTDSQIASEGLNKKIYNPGDNCTFEYSWLDGAIATRDYTFYAVWEKNALAQYTITYNANGGSGAPANQTKVQGTDLTLSTSKPTRTGYNFLGWATSASATAAQYSAGSVYKNDAAVTLYAVWEKIPATLSDISIAAKPSKTTYELGEDLDTSGLTLKLTYSDGSTKNITNGFTTSGFSSATAGTKTITVSYGGKTTTFDVVVKPAAVDENEQQVVVENKTATAGETIEIGVSLKNNPGIAGLAISLKYDESVLTLVEAKDGGLLGGFAASKNYSWDEDDNVCEDGLLVTFVFTVAENAKSGDYSIEIIVRSCIDVDLNDVEFVSPGGIVSVVDFVYGDSNGDQKIDMKDVVLLRKYITNFDYDTNTSSIDVNSGADANADGKIDMKDVVLLRKYITNYDYDTESSTIVLGPQ